MDVSFSRVMVKMFGALGKDGHHIQVADALNPDTFISLFEEPAEDIPKACPRAGQRVMTQVRRGQ